MRPQKQLFKHDPANGVYGDCHRAAIATIFLVSDQGSDPPILGVLGLKNSQSQGIVDPLAGQTERAHYQQLRARGKLGKVALVACMRKLLTIVNARRRDELRGMGGAAITA